MKEKQAELSFGEDNDYVIVEPDRDQYLELLRLDLEGKIRICWVAYGTKTKPSYIKMEYRKIK